MSSLFERLLDKLASFWAVRVVLMMMIYSIDSDRAFKAGHEQTYGEHSVMRDRKSSCPINFSPQRSYWLQPSSAPFKRRPAVASSRRPPRKVDNADCMRAPLDLEWRRIPEAPIWFRCWRWMSNIWFTYMLLRYLLIGRLRALLEWGNSAARLDSRPVHCYLIGRFVLDKNFAELMGACLALMHIAWRFSQLFARPHPLAMVYFLLFNRHDLELVHAQLPDANEPIRGGPSERHRLGPRERLTYDTMCYQVSCRRGALLRLRANRTHLAHQQLRRRTARLFATVAFAIMLPATLVVTPLVMNQLLIDSRFLDTYPGCDPAFEQRVTLDGGSRAISWPWTPRRLLIFWADAFENLFIWIESGTNCAFLPILIHLMSYDLLLAWRGIVSRVNAIERQLREEDANGHEQELAELTAMRDERLERILRPRWTCDGLKYPQTRASSRLSGQIYQLLSEISDFFEQIRKLDLFMRQTVLAYAISCIGFCTIFTYFSQTKSIGQLPIELTAMFMALALGLICCCLSFLVVSRHCLASYTQLCSLMALDRWKSEHNFETIIEFYTMKKFCFTLVGQYPFQATTFLSLLGWTFSCFCLITGSLRHA